VGLGVGAIGSISLVSLGSGGRNSFEHQNKFLIFEQIMNISCQAKVFQLPHHRQYFIVVIGKHSETHYKIQKSDKKE
jgi:hypothetical protein